MALQPMLASALQICHAVVSRPCNRLHIGIYYNAARWHTQQQVGNWQTGFSNSSHVRVHAEISIEVIWLENIKGTETFVTCHMLFIGLLSTFQINVTA